MTRDEIISMAREAGFVFIEQRDGSVLPEHSTLIESFAALVAAAEREACAALCDRFQARDAERYRWLRAYNTAKHPAVTEAFFLGDENLDSAIDAAIAAEKGGAAFRAMIEKGQS